MKTVTHVFTGAGVSTVVAASPSGSRYVVMGLSCTSGIVTAVNYPSSGLYAVAIAAAPLSNMTVYPSGDALGFAEGLELQASAACTASVSYIVQAPKLRDNEYSLHTVFDAKNQVVSSGWPEIVQSGSYTQGFGG